MMHCSRPCSSSVHGFGIARREDAPSPVATTVTCNNNNNNSCTHSSDLSRLPRDVSKERSYVITSICERVALVLRLLHELVRSAVFPGRMVILRYCIAHDLFSDRTVRFPYSDNYPSAFLFA